MSAFQRQFRFSSTLLPVLLGSGVISSFGASLGPTPLTLHDAIERAYVENPQITAASARESAERAAIRSQASPDNPMVGIQYEQNLSAMEAQEGPMRLWSVTQDLKFPIKYVLLGAAQSARAAQAENEASALRLEVRQKVVAAYYRAFAMGRTLDLLRANLDLAKKTSRTAEARYSTGQVPQQDEMKAHTEETRINAEILMTEEELEAARSDLAALLTADGKRNFELSSPELPSPELLAPKLSVKLESVQELAARHARHIKHYEEMLSESESRATLALMNYLPDFRLGYRKAYSGATSDAYAFSIEASVPLWFFMKQAPEVAQARAEKMQAEKKLEQIRTETTGQVRQLARKTQNHQTLLEIYETTFIPQATSTLNSSESAYRAGKINLLELLDSSRALFQTRIAYYRTLAEYAESLSALESVTGVSLSDLPFPPPLSASISASSSDREAVTKETVK